MLYVVCIIRQNLDIKQMCITALHDRWNKIKTTTELDQWTE